VLLCAGKAVIPLIFYIYIKRDIVDFMISHVTCATRKGAYVAQVLAALVLAEHSPRRKSADIDGELSAGESAT
jgi:hypothetical protein